MTLTYQPAAGSELRHAGFPCDALEIRASGDAKQDTLTIAGHAAVYDRLSADLGGFRERIVRGAFDKVLDTNPTVLLVYQHDQASTMASTANRTLELRSDPSGLRVWAKVDKDDYHVRMIAPKIKRGDIGAMSFAFRVATDGDKWTTESDPDTGQDIPVRTILQVGGLYDVSVVATPAYAQTDVSLRGILDAALSSGRLIVGADHRDSQPPAGIADPAAPADPVDGLASIAPADPVDARTTPLLDERRGKTLRRTAATIRRT